MLEVAQDITRGKSFPLYLGRRKFFCLDRRDPAALLPDDQNQKRFLQQINEAGYIARHSRNQTMKAFPLS
jgi:hypothetical protein